MKISFEGQTLYDVTAQMHVFLSTVGGDGPLLTKMPESAMSADAPDSQDPAPEEPAPKKTKAKPKADPAPEEETVPDEDKTAALAEKLAESRKAAISRLMALFNRGGKAQAAVKDLLKDFDVKKFSDVGDARIADLLARANELDGTFAE